MANDPTFCSVRVPMTPRCPRCRWRLKKITVAIGQASADALQCKKCLKIFKAKP